MLTINGFNYFAPLSSPKRSDYDKFQNIRESSIIVLRMVMPIKNKYQLSGTIKLNNMMPVPEKEIMLYDFADEQDNKYRDLIRNELFWIQRNTQKIQSAALRIYNVKKYESQTKNNRNEKFLNSIMSFKDAELKRIEYIKNSKDD